MRPDCTYTLNGQELTYEAFKAAIVADPAMRAKYLNAGSTPDMPFSKTWPLQMFKRALRDAVAAGKQWIGWAPGTVQADRYSLAKQVSAVKWDNIDGEGKKIGISFRRTGENTLTDGGIHLAEKLPDVVGKELAEKIVEKAQGTYANESGEFTGLDLKLGGEGMKGFYDKILPAEVGKYVKQWGGAVEKARIDTGREIAGEWKGWDISGLGAQARLLLKAADGDIDAAIAKSTEWDSATQRLANAQLTELKPKGRQPYGDQVWRVEITPRMKAAVSEHGQAIYSQPVRLLKDKGVPLDELDRRTATAAEETANAPEDNANFRTIIDPTRSLGAGVDAPGDPAILAASHLYDETITEQTIEQWDKEARAMLSRDYEGTVQAIVRAGHFNQALTPQQTRAAEMVLEMESRLPMNDRQLRRIQALTWAFRLTGTATARAMAARRDMFKTRAERHRAALAKMIFTPPPEVRTALEKAKEPIERVRILRKDEKRLKEITHALAKMGVTIEDVLNGDRVLVARRAEILKTTIGDKLDDRHKAAALDALGGALTFDAIGAKHGMSGREAAKAFATAKATFEAEIRRRIQMAAAARGVNKALNAAAVATRDPMVEFDFGSIAEMPEAEQEEAIKAIMEAVGFFPAHMQGKRKLVTRQIPPKKPGEKESPVKPGPDTGTISVIKGADLADVTDVYRNARITAAAGASALDKMREFWINNLLSGPVTQFKNATSNALFGTWNLVASRGIEAMLNTVVRNETSASLGEFGPILKAMAPAIARGARLFALAWDTEADHFHSEVLGEEMKTTGPAGEPAMRTAIAGTKGRVIRWPGRLLMAVDGFTKGLFGTLEAAGHAYRITKAEGLKPGTKEFDTAMQKQLYTRGSEAWHAAATQAEVNTFQQDLDATKNPIDSVPKAIIGLSQSRYWPVRLLTTLLFPFTKTPYNVYREGIRRSPVGSLLLAYHAAKGTMAYFKDGKLSSDVQQDLVRGFAEQIIAWTMTAVLAGAVEGDDDDYAKTLLITGSAPKDYGAREMQERAFGGPYVIKIGKTVIPYGGIEPVATILGTLADFMRAKKSGGTPDEKINALFHSVKRGAIDKTFLSGIKGLADLLAKDESSFGPTMSEKARRFVLQAIVPNVIRQPMRNADSRVPDGSQAPWWYDAIPAPQAVPGRVNAGSGEEKQKTMNAAARVFIPSAVKPEESVHPVDRVLLAWNRQFPRQHWEPEGADKSMQLPNGQRVDLKPEVIHYLNTRSGTLARKMLGNATLQPVERDVERIKDAYREALKMARDSIKGRPIEQLGTLHEKK